jgi:hypothetical protein
VCRPNILWIVLTFDCGPSRVELEYPLSRTGPPTAIIRTAMNPVPPPNHYVRSSAPHIALPVLSRMPPGQAPYIKRFDPLAETWLSTVETDPYVFIGNIVADPPTRPEISRSGEPQPSITDISTANLLFVSAVCNHIIRGRLILSR